MVWFAVGASKYAQRSRILGGGKLERWYIVGRLLLRDAPFSLVRSSLAQPQTVLLGSGAGYQHSI